MKQIYTPLDSGSIRLLELHDNTGLSSTLTPSTLQEAPPFIALSYTWGEAASRKARSPKQGHAIVVNGHKMSVQQNLYDAITTLAEDVRNWDGRNHRFWVDFICINQSDLGERSSQVMMMKDIYEKSAAVFAWLGLPHNMEEISLAMKLMRSFNKHLHSELEKNHDIDVVLANIGSHNPGFPSVDGSDEWKAWMGIAEIMERNYWVRTWIHQEATTPGEIWFYCGKECFNDVHLDATSTFGSQFSLKCPEFDSRFSISVGLGSNMSRLASARLQREQFQEQSLLTLVEEVRLTDCSDDRDKIYAALGRAADIGTGQITADYSKDVKTVFADLVRFEVNKAGTAGLRILEYVYTPAPEASNDSLSEVLDPSWPSWIPDWRQIVSLVPFYPIDDSQPLLADPCPGSGIEVDFCGDTMSIKGSTLEQNSITYLTQICEDDRDVTRLTKAWYVDMTADDPSKVTEQSIRRSLVADVSGFKPDTEGIGHRTRGYMVDWDTVHLDDHMSGRISNVCLGRRMGRTESGYIGIFPAAAQKGDIVSMFHGGHLLYLLQPVSGLADHFRFIGTCYVDGLMDGQAAELSTSPRMLHLV